MTISSLLIANRGEIALRVASAALELGLRAVAVHSEDDAASPHAAGAPERRLLRGVGPAAYLDGEQLIAVAREAGCDAIHPGYGFLSENAAFARACEDAGLVFVGPASHVLALFGDKARARAFALECDVPVLPGTEGEASVAQVQDFLRSLGPGRAIMIKAVAGGGGRGMRVVQALEDVADAFAQCAAEASSAFGHGGLYAERLVARARHLEVQVLGDGTGAVVHLWERECSLQRRNQKVVEFAPAFGVPPAVLERLRSHALRMAARAKFRGLGTFEFLLEPGSDGAEAGVFFMEANPRLQVEHTVTEAVTGIDLVQAQLRIAGGATLAALGLASPPQVRGRAVQLRVNMETLDAQGGARPGGGVISAFALPSGPGIRVDTFGQVGYAPSPRFDSLLAKLIVHTPIDDQGTLLDKASRALDAFRIGGVPTNADLLHGLLADLSVRQQDIHTCFVDEHLAALLEAGQARIARLAPATAGSSDALLKPVTGDEATQILAPMLGTVVEIGVRSGDLVEAGQVVATLEAMKMQHLVHAPRPGRVTEVLVRLKDAVQEGQALVGVDFSGEAGGDQQAASQVPLDHVPAALAGLLQRREFLFDGKRPKAVESRHSRGQRTVRENVADLVDPGSFTEYGALAIAAQRSRRTLEDLIANTPADGIVIGVGTVNAATFGAGAARCMVFAYDYTVLAGTQGRVNHEKTDRALAVAEKLAVPVIVFAEGGGGRPGDVDSAKVPKLNLPTFARFARLSGLAPRIGIVSGNCFAGNAALLGCCDVIIATRNASIGMGGPAMIEGAGLGACKPSDVGPVSVQVPNGVIDVLVDDEAQAVAAARQFLGYFQGATDPALAPAADQRVLRHLIPENRLQSYDVRAVISALADPGSVLELRPKFGVGILTAFVRIEGRPFGLVANNSRHIGGAIDADAADKAARFMQLCDAFDLPMVSLCDTPGFMVGPDAEKTALVRHVSRMFIVAANLSVPYVTIVLRKGYGLGALAMAAGGFHEPLLTVAWPCGEFGGMGLEGAVRLGYRKELAEIADETAREARYQALLAEEYAKGSAQHLASHVIVDDVIDPADTRRVILSVVSARASAPRREGKKRTFVDVW